MGLLQPAPHMPLAPVADGRATPSAKKHGKLSSSGATKSPKSPGSSSRAKPKKKIKKKKAQHRETPRAEGEPDALVDEVDDEEESEEEEGDEEIEAVVEEGVAAGADDEALLHEPPADDEPLTRSEKKKAIAVAKAMGFDHEAAVAAAKQKIIEAVRRMRERRARRAAVKARREASLSGQFAAEQKAREAKALAVIGAALKAKRQRRADKLSAMTPPSTLRCLP